MYRTIFTFTFLILFIFPGRSQRISGYLDIGEFQNGVAVAVSSNDKSTLINEKGEDVLNFKYEWVEKVSRKDNGYYLVLNSLDMCGMVNSTGEVVVDFEYDDYEPLTEEDEFIEDSGIGIFWQGDEKIFTNYRGNIIAKADFQNLNYFKYNNSLFSIRSKDGKYGIFKEDENLMVDGTKDSLIIDFKYGFILETGFDTNGLVIVGIPSSESVNTVGVINMKGETVIDFKHTAIGHVPATNIYSTFSLDEETGEVKTVDFNSLGEKIN